MAKSMILAVLLLVSAVFGTATTTTTVQPTTTAAPTTAAPTTTPTTTTPTPPNAQIVMGAYGNVSISLSEGEFVVYRMNVTADQLCEDEELEIDVTSTGNFAKRLEVSSTGLTQNCEDITTTQHYTLAWLDSEVFYLDTDMGADCADGTTTCDTTTSPVELGSGSETYEICTMFWCEAAGGCTITGTMEVMIYDVDISIGIFDFCGVPSLEVFGAFAIALLSFFF